MTNNPGPNITKSPTKGRPILVTGAAGFIGSHVVRRLLSDGHAVVALIKKDTDTKRIADLLPRLIVIHDDLMDQARLEEKLEEINPQGIFHLASSMVRSGVGAPEAEIIKANVIGTMHLVRALEGVDYKFFINSGSALEYGVHDVPLRESDVCEPREAYSLSKLASTLYCQAAARNTGKPIVTFRLFTPYGADMVPGQLFHAVVSRALKNEEIALTNPEVSRDFIFIDDVIDLYIDAMDKAATFTGEIFNVGSGKATNLKELAEHVLRLTGSKSPVKWGAAKEAVYDRGCKAANMDKTFKAFAWRPTRDLDSGIKALVSSLSGL